MAAPIRERRAELCVNPHLRLERVYEDGVLERIRVWAPVRGKSLRDDEIGAGHYGQAFRKLAAAMSSPAGLTSATAAEGRELLELGVLVRSDNVSETITFEIPPLASSASGSVAPPLFGPGDLERFTAVTSHTGRMVWTQSSPIGVIHPWSIADDAVRPVLHEVARSGPDFEPAADESARAFAADGYAVIQLDLPAAQLGALQRYYDGLRANGWLQFGDDQSRRYCSHNDPVAVALQWRILPLVRYVTRAAVIPSYAYAVTYVHGAELSKHIDREQCKYTVALLLDLAPPETGDVSPWPLRLYPPAAGADGIDVYQTIGQAVVYYGQTIPHARAPLAACRSSTSLLLHYVDEDFRGPLL